MWILEYVCTYRENLLTTMNGNFDNHLTKLEEVLQWLQKAGLHVIVAKSNFAHDEIEYLGYVLIREGIKPPPQNVPTF